MYTGYIDPRPWDEYFPSKDRQMPQEVLPGKPPINGNKAFYGGRFDWAVLDKVVLPEIKENDLDDIPKMGQANAKLIV